MRARFAAIIVALAVLTPAIAVPADAAPTAKYKTCKQLNKKFKNGVAMSGISADAAQAAGYYRPKVNMRVYFNNQRLRKAGTYYLCPRLVPESVPSEPANLRAQPWGYSTPALLVNWDTPAVGNERNSLVFDVYLNGALWREGIPVATVSQGSNSVTIEPLAGDTAYTVGVMARNASGTSPMAQIAAATGPQSKYDHPGQTLITYELSGSSGSYSITAETSDGGTLQRNPVGNGVVYEEWFGTGKFVYLSAQNQNGSGTVTCTIKRNGEVYKTVTSEGAYVIATCSGRS